MQTPENSSQPHIFEKLNLGLSIIDLKNDLALIQSEFPPVMQSPSFGGWSVTSTDGDYRSGWEKGYLAIVESAEGPKINAPLNGQLTLPKTSDAKVPTQICRGSILSAIDKIRTFGFLVRRVRISILKANTSSAWHRDALPSQYAVRLHIPILTNPGCVFVTEVSEEHIPADGDGYLVSVSQLHQIRNSSNEDRFHLMMDVIDAQNVSRFHGIEAFHLQNQSKSK